MNAEIDMTCRVCGGTWGDPRQVWIGRAGPEVACPADCHDPAKWEALAAIESNVWDYAARTVKAESAENGLRSGNAALRARIVKLEQAMFDAGALCAELDKGQSYRGPRYRRNGRGIVRVDADEDVEAPDTPMFDDDEQGEDGDDHPMRSEADQRELDDHPYPKFGVQDEDEPTNGRWAAAEDDRRWAEVEQDAKARFDEESRNIREFESETKRREADDR